MQNPISTILIAILATIPTLLLLAASAHAAPASSEKRVALVIGNSKYEHTRPLDNPGNDARAVAAALKRLGFEVEMGLDLTKARTDEYLRRFGDRLMGAQVGLFYYAGHGLQVDGVNYIAPVDARLVRERDLNYEVVRMDKVLMEMDTARRINLIILDACRDNPLADNLARSMRQGRSAAVGRGLAPMQAATGTLIAYATRDGTLALDGEGQQHSPYTQALLEVIETPGVEVGLLLRRVRERVMAATGEQQVPWEYGSLIGEFYFVPPGGPPKDTVQPPLPLGTGTLLVEPVQPGARVFVDNADRGVGRVEVQVPVGRRQIRVELSGYLAYEQTVEVAAGRTAHILPSLVAEARTGRLFVQADPSDAVVKVLRIAPVYHPGMELEPGRYEIEVGKSGYATRRVWVSIVAGKDLHPSIRLESLASSAPKPGDVWKESHTGMEFVWVPEGCFQMGQTEAEKRYLLGQVSQEVYDMWYKHELPRHEVCVKGYWMGRHEVTVGQFRQFVRETGHRSDAHKQGKAYIFNKDTEWKWEERSGYHWENPGFSQTDRHPVVTVSWNDAQAFAKWLSGKSGRKIVLPTEAQWEYAARGGTTTMRFWGDVADQACGYANVLDKAWGAPRHECTDGYQFTAPVGNYKANPFGLYDMLGNVWEWVEDGFDANAYSRSGRRNDPVVTSGSARVLRGGSWVNLPGLVRSAYRYGLSPDNRISVNGFRLARAAQD